MTAGRSRPRRLELDERREQLVRVGTELFAARAYDEISIDDIAAAAGISKGLLYHYFPSKREFYVGTVRAAGEELQRLTRKPDPREALDAYLDYVEHHAQGYATLSRGAIGSDAEVRAIVEATRAAFTDRVLGELNAAGPVMRHAVRGWIGFVEAASLEWLDRRDVGRDTLRELLIGALDCAAGAAQRVQESA
jgi:AcrR family transcriptional regulator